MACETGALVVAAALAVVTVGSIGQKHGNQCLSKIL